MVTAETPALSVHHRYGEDAVRTFRARGWWRDGSTRKVRTFLLRERARRSC